MTVNDVFKAAGLTPSSPIRWNMESTLDVSSLPDRPGVYVVARIGSPDEPCIPCELRLRIPSALVLNSTEETNRWLPYEPVVYIGQATGQTLQKRLKQFHRHQCGQPSPHAGGQVVKLLTCKLWIYWSEATNPRGCEQTMIDAFKKRLGKNPFANAHRGRGHGRRIRRVIEPDGP